MATSAARRWPVVVVVGVIVGVGVVSFFRAEVSHPLRQLVVQLLLLFSQLNVKPRVSLNVEISLAAAAVAERIWLVIKIMLDNFFLLLLR